MINGHNTKNNKQISNNLFNCKDLYSNYNYQTIIINVKAINYNT